MAPSPSSVLGENAHSALLSSSSIITPIIITVSSAAGISAVSFLAIVALTTYRRVRARQVAEEKRKSVPQLVITDTSMFPTCNVVVNGEADLDKVIASHKPLGKDSRTRDERKEISAQDVSRARQYEVEEEEQMIYPPPIIPKPTRTRREPQYCDRHNATLEDKCDMMKHSLQLDETEINEAVFWWHEFNTAAVSQVSDDSMTDADESVSSGSLYSSGSHYHGPNTFKQAAHLSSATMSALNRMTGAEDLSGDIPQRRKSLMVDPAEEVGDESQETLYDKDVVAYCWRLSDDGVYRTRSNSRSIRQQQIEEEGILPEMVARRKSQSKGCHPTNDTAIDQRILEYCWRLSDNSSTKSIHDTSIMDTKRRRSMTTTRSVSESI